MEKLENAIIEIKKAFPAMKILENEPMSAHSSMRVGGAIRALASPSDVSSLAKLCCILKEHELAPLMLGNCTNTVFPDEGMPDVFAISTEKLTKLFLLPDGAIYAECGVPLSRLAAFAQQNGLAGLEFASGIPGSVGGGVMMNAGAYGGEIKQVLTKVEYIEDGAVCSVEPEDSDLGYRFSRFAAPERIVLSAEFSLSPDDGMTKERMKDYSERRRAKQPLTYPSAGSTFKRPAGYYAGALIEQADLKGVSVGGAEVSTLHAGFIINKGGATSEDVKRLIELVQERVYENSGVALETEVKFIGR